MKLLVGLFAVSLAVGSFAQSKTGAKRVKDRSKEIRSIESLISKINAHGGCQPTKKIKNGEKVNAPRADFGVERLLHSNCSGTIKKVRNGSNKSVVIDSTRCKNVIIGFNKENGYFSQNNNEGTRMYQFDYSKGDVGSASLTISPKSLRRGNDTVVIVASNSGKTCSYFEANF